MRKNVTFSEFLTPEQRAVAERHASGDATDLELLLSLQKGYGHNAESERSRAERVSFPTFSQFIGKKYPQTPAGFSELFRDLADYPEFSEPAHWEPAFGACRWIHCNDPLAGRYPQIAKPGALIEMRCSSCHTVHCSLRFQRRVVTRPTDQVALFAHDGTPPPSAPYTVKRPGTSPDPED